MPWRIKIFFYLSAGFSLCVLIFPTHVTQAIGWYVGDMVHWIYGFYILFPRNPVGEPRFYFMIQIQGYFLIINIIILVVVCFVELRNAKLGIPYEKNLIYAIAILQLVVSQFYQLSGPPIVMYLSIYGFYFSAIFAIMGNKELNSFYIKKGIVNVKNERILGVVLIITSIILIVHGISISLCCVIPFGTDGFPSSIAIGIFLALTLYLIMLFYGIYSLIKAKRINISKLQ